MMCKKIMYLMFVFLLCLICTSYVSAQIVYVDATEGEEGNTTLAAGGVFNSVASDSGSDNLWRGRSPFGNSGTIFEAGGQGSPTANTEDCPRLKTSIDVPEGDYNVYVYFWCDVSQWRIQASLTDSVGDLPLYMASPPGSTAAIAEDFAAPIPLLTEGNRTLWQASLGNTGSTTTINVYIDDSANHQTNNSRTWYDGIGYKAVE